MSLLILLSPNISFSCVGTEPKQQTLPFQFKQGLLTRPFFSLGGLGLCQKVCICMPNLVMLITHFGQKRKYWPSKCPSRADVWMAAEKCNLRALKIAVYHHLVRPPHKLKPFFKIRFCLLFHVFSPLNYSFDSKFLVV